MALEHDIASLVEASEALTSTVDNKIQSIDSAVSSKMTEVNNFVAQQKARVDSSLDDLRIIGDGTMGTRAIGVANAFTGERLETNVHLKLPFKVSEDNQMFHITVSGYAYGESKAVSATFVGYCYKNGNKLTNTQCTGTHAPSLYRGKDEHVYCRLSFTDTYFLTISVDTMQMGGYRLIKHGDIQVIFSPEDDVTVSPADQA
ncbi:hypothetical protein [Pseudoalteromonas sp. R3]|uniref:hypothetical protein n=1 Tax=Pseudoalteromonas sp. R3 TaxID=1709477 RepID=UPI0006B4EF3B|nr:hypothetical protein [Pseudoalteromonas sp. R3]AZZ99109.1 hypothetical protein ELR70_19595 [Pseudoalteromonas sp. R3]